MKVCTRNKKKREISRVPLKQVVVARLFKIGLQFCLLEKFHLHEDFQVKTFYWSPPKKRSSCHFFFQVCCKKNKKHFRQIHVTKKKILPEQNQNKSFEKEVVFKPISCTFRRFREYDAKSDFEEQFYSFVEFPQFYLITLFLFNLPNVAV